MIDGLLHAMLGPILSPVLDFVEQNTGIISILLGTWLAVYLAGLWQVSRIKTNTRKLVVENGRKYLQEKPQITSGGVYKRVYSEWGTAIKQWALFVPHRQDLWPVRVTPETVKAKFDFSAEWVAEVLMHNGIELEEFSRIDSGSEAIPEVKSKSKAKSKSKSK